MYSFKILPRYWKTQILNGIVTPVRGCQSGKRHESVACGD